MGILINLIGAVLLLLSAVYVFRRKSHAKRINTYFCNAVRAYALTNEEDARIAIVTAAKIAAKTQRGSMVKYLQKSTPCYLNEKFFYKTRYVLFKQNGMVLNQHCQCAP